MILLPLNLLAADFESTLSISRDDLRSEIGWYAEIGRDSDEWADSDNANVESWLKTGLRQFYTAHRWTFLEPIKTFNTVANTGDYTLAADFGGMKGDLTFGAELSYRPIPTVGEQQIRSLRQDNTSAGIPALAALRVQAGASGQAGQRWTLLLYPIPDAIYELTYRYRILPNALTADRKYPLGGEHHAETIMASCLAAAELKLNNAKGPMWDDYLNKVAHSIEVDNQMLPEYLGYNADCSDSPPVMTRSAWRGRSNYMVTLNGVVP